ncbi:hypothetical protein ACFOWB_12070 [Chenggangzhangella methanolivorans]|uniref:hypothetical protein n=1 Tax=Chenggangzhangella methanolivorans TaxID=1437009 RepID=UPI00361D1BE0
MSTWSSLSAVAAATDRTRSVLAYGALALGVAGTASIVPLVIWALALRGFH